MKRWLCAVTLLVVAGSPAEAGLFSKKKPKDEVPGGHPPQMVAPNGVVAPTWASKRIAESPVPLFGKSWGRRPWALPLSTQATPSAAWARADQLGFGAGPIPGFTNGPSASGNYPMASVGADEVNGWGPRPGLRNLFMPGTYPGATGYLGY